VRIDELHTTKQFQKLFIRLPARKQTKVKDALKRAVADLDDPQLRLHELQGQDSGTFSISAGGDLRIHFELIEQEGRSIASLQAVGTHSQLYG